MIEMCQVWKPDNPAFLLYVQFDDKTTEIRLFDRICRPYKIIADDLNSMTIRMLEDKEMKK